MKLGYGGTKTEMQRLVKDAAKIDKSIDANSLSYANVVKSIHAVQKNLSITGTTAKEAEKTISGSLSAMKSSWGNLLTAFVSGGDNLDQCIDNMVSSVKTFAGNVIPAAEKALSGLGDVIEGLAPIIAKEIPSTLASILPKLIKASTTILNSLIQALVKAMPQILPSLASGVVQLMVGIGKTIVSNAGELFNAARQVAAEVVKALYEGITGQPMGEEAFNNVKNTIDTVFSSVKKIVSGIIQFGSTLMTALAPVLTFIGGIALNVFGCIADNISWLLPLVTALVGAFLAYKAALVVVNVITTIVTTAQTIMAAVTGTASAAAAVSAPQILAFAAAILAVGASILMICIGFALLANAAISLASAGWGAIAVMAGLIAVIALLAVGAAALGTALTAGAIGFVAFGAAALMVGAGFALIGVGALLAATSLQIIAGVLPMVAAYGLQSSGALVALGVSMIAFAAGAAVAGAAALVLGAGLLVVSAAMVVIAASFTVIVTMFMLLTAATLVFRLAIQALPTLFSLIITQMLAFVTALTPLTVALLAATAPLLAFTAAVAVLAVSFTLLAATSVVFLVAMAGLVATTMLLSVLFRSIVAVAKVLVIVFMLIGSSAIQLASLLMPLSKTLTSMCKPLLIVTASFTVFSAALLLVVTAINIINSAFAKMLGLLMMITQMLAALLALLKSVANTFTQVAKTPDLLNKSLENMATKGSATTWQFISILRTFQTTVRSIMTEISRDMSNIVNSSIVELVNKITQLPKKMGDGLKSAGKSLSSSLVEIWEDAVKASATPVNKVIDGANWILKQFGSDKRVVSWTPYANGTDGHKGGNALVNDGNGAELVQMPNGNTFIPQGRNVFIPNAPKGMKVLPADKTAALMGRKAPAYRYADGTGDIDVFSFIDSPADLISKVSSKYVSYEGMSGFALNAGKAMVSTVTGEMTSWVKSLFDEYGAKSLASYVSSAGVEQWRSTVIQALKMTGQYSEANVKRTLYQMQTESGGNPRAINLWDSNAKKGIPSKGLMQCIDPTFQAYAMAGHNSNIYDPLSNILASIRYAVSRYGSLAKAYQGHGYANGGIANKPSIFGEDGSEMAIPLSKSKRQQGVNLWRKTGGILGMDEYTPENTVADNSKTTQNNNYSPQFNLTIQGADSGTNKRTVKQWIKEGFEECFESIGRTNNIDLQEV